MGANLAAHIIIVVVPGVRVSDEKFSLRNSEFPAQQS
tara:strand:- start:931 stop:1041 length:111 start_codon:yes stop_codon:yes gene_type:complete